MIIKNSCFYIDDSGQEQITPADQVWIKGGPSCYICICQSLLTKSCIGYCYDCGEVCHTYCPTCEEDDNEKMEVS